MHTSVQRPNYASRVWCAIELAASEAQVARTATFETCDKCDLVQHDKMDAAAEQSAGLDKATGFNGAYFCCQG